MIAIERSVTAARVGAKDEGLTIITTWQAAASTGKCHQAVVVVAVAGYVGAM